MPTNSDLKRWYKVYNVKDRDFVRYDTNFRILCFDATDDFHAVNLGQMNDAIQKAIQGQSHDINIENGSGDVLIQTTDTNHSFKVMTDGRAKVQSAPTESDDVVRKLELDGASVNVLTQSQVDSLF